MIINIAGYDVLIDEDDFERVNSMKWHIRKCGKGEHLYAAHSNSKPPHSIFLHKFILNAPYDIEVDHKNCNTLDNRKENLRMCSHAENLRNRRININNTSGYKGVSFCKNHKRWEAQISVNGQKKRIGYFCTPEKAYKAYCEASKIYHGEFHRVS
jgi:hypothetical protein